MREPTAERESRYKNAIDGTDLESRNSLLSGITLRLPYPNRFGDHIRIPQTHMMINTCSG